MPEQVVFIDKIDCRVDGDLLWWTIYSGGHALPPAVTTRAIAREINNIVANALDAADIAEALGDGVVVPLKRKA